MDDMGKIAVVAAIMGALLLFGVLANRPAPAPVVTEVTSERVVSPAKRSLELLDPIYSEKAIYHDQTLRVAFHTTFIDGELESRLGFWLHNTSGDVINILWDRCSLQLPSGNTVPVVSENTLHYGASMGQVLSVAPGADLFDALIPLTEIDWTAEGPIYSVNALDKGSFTLILAVERAALVPCTLPCVLGGAQLSGPQGAAHLVPPAMACPAGTREIIHYVFRFVVR